MYTVTFFSFKGGVGRSMALMNVAFELAKDNKKVFLMDFDLEAPGLNTFGLCEEQSINGGIVNFVHEYMSSNSAPEIENHVIACKSSYIESDLIWLMPAGTPDNYANKLSEINWRDLYEHNDGFFLFEELKAQIQEKYAPDYLLIDSRTGHTDIGGICTRQLPNAVVFLFFPNEQNLLGLKKIVDQVNVENSMRSTVNQITKHFVNSNVPDLDDENRILAARLVEFERQLGFKDLLTIHRYNSLTLLNQEIFTVQRPNTRLAAEYKTLVKAIVQENPEDRDGSINFLTSLIKDRNNTKLNQSLVSERVEKISEKHGTDASLLNLISHYKEQLGEYESAVKFIQNAIIHGYNEPSGYLRQAKLNLVSDNKMQALEALERFLSLENVSFSELSLAINLINRISPEFLHVVINSSAFLSLTPEDTRTIIESQFLVDSRRKVLVEDAVSNVLYRNEKKWTRKQSEMVRSTLGLLYISQGQFSKAVKLFDSNIKYEDVSRLTLFNYAMACWGMERKPPILIFERFLERIKNFDFASENAGFKQCLALAYWVAGSPEIAIDIAKIAQQQSRDIGALTFSCWTYLYRSPKEFAADINEMLRMFAGEEIKPKIFREADRDLFQNNLI